jgi:hypothetical protein
MRTAADDYGIGASAPGLYKRRNNNEKTAGVATGRFVTSCDRVQIETIRTRT